MTAAVLRRAILYPRMVVEHKLAIPLLLHRKRQRDARTGAAEKLMVNIGGAYFFAPGWRTMEYISPAYPYKRGLIDYEHDLTAGTPFPFSDGSVDLFYSSHTFEHIPQEHLPRAFREIHRTLRPGGAVRITVPDFDIVYAAYRAGQSDFVRGRMTALSPEKALVRWIAAACVDGVTDDEIRTNLARMSKEEFADFYSLNVPRATQAQNGANHINWFNYDKLERMLREAGFRDIYRSAAQQSRFPEMRGEGRARGLGWLFHGAHLLGFDTSIPEKSVFAEAIK
jgi:predicted SAM-dependent methyltransferase